ncbi:MAG TPA: class I SAM-dependent methyltransferase, partial [Acidimicrobiales bacterium]
ADLGDPGWLDALREGGFDAVVSATALHWLAEPVLRRVYRDLHGLVRPGGVVANADEMAPDDLPVLSRALGALARCRCAALRADGRPDWDTWWDVAAADPALAGPVAERRRFFGGDHADEFAPPAGWHVSALAGAGFSEAGVAWRSGGGAVVAAVR